MQSLCQCNLRNGEHIELAIAPLCGPHAISRSASCKMHVVFHADADYGGLTVQRVALPKDKRCAEGLVQHL